MGSYCEVLAKIYIHIQALNTSLC